MSSSPSRRPAHLGMGLFWVSQLAVSSPTWLEPSFCGEEETHGFLSTGDVLHPACPSCNVVQHLEGVWDCKSLLLLQAPVSGV